MSRSTAEVLIFPGFPARWRCRPPTKELRCQAKLNNHELFSRRKFDLHLSSCLQNTHYKCQWLERQDFPMSTIASRLRTKAGGEEAIYSVFLAPRIPLLFVQPDTADRTRAADI